MAASRSQVERLLPLKPALYLILLSLADGDRHGYAVKKDVLRRTDGRVTLGPGTLYRSIRQLEERGLVAETDDRPDPVLDDERRRYFRITRLGRRVVTAETERLSQLVEAARATTHPDGRTR